MGYAAGDLDGLFAHLKAVVDRPVTRAENGVAWTKTVHFVKVNRIKEFPMEANLTRSTVTTPIISDSTNYNTISMLDKGRVQKETAVVRGEFKKEKLRISEL